MEEQVGIEAIKFNQNPSGNRHPNGGQHGRSRKIGQKMFHGTLSLITVNGSEVSEEKQ
jgi:hypothetical protein